MKNLRTAVVMQAAYMKATQGENDPPEVFVGVVKYMLRNSYNMLKFEPIPNAMIVDFTIANFDAITE